MRYMEAFRKGNSQGEFHQSFRSQSAMEYLVTYGWAILIIAVVLAALFELGVFNPMTFAPKASPGSCQVVRPEGAGTTNFISLEGECNGELPQYVGRFNGAIGAGIVGYSLPAINVNAFTLTAWIDVSYYTNSGPSYNIFTIFKSGGGYVFLNKGACLGCSPALTAVSSTVSVVYGVGSSKPQPSTNTWYFVAATWNGTSNTIRIYQNNQLAGQGPENGSVLYPMSGAFSFGSAADGSQAFYGDLSNEQLYNVALSQPEITALYQEGIGGAPIDLQNLVGWWPLNGNANDYSGNGNNGVPNGVTYTSNWYSGYSAP